MTHRPLSMQQSSICNASIWRRLPEARWVLYTKTLILPISSNEKSACVLYRFYGTIFFMMCRNYDTWTGQWCQALHWRTSLSLQTDAGSCVSWKQDFGNAASAENAADTTRLSTSCVIFHSDCTTLSVNTYTYTGWSKNMRPRHLIADILKSLKQKVTRK